jgi:hypothetical protein
MSSSPVKRILLPTVGVSVGIFFLMMAAFAAYRSSTPSFRQSSVNPEDEMAQTILASEQGNWRVRQVGLALMVSIGSGLAIVEVLRRWYAFRDSGETKAKQLGLEEFFATESNPDEKGDEEMRG